MNSLRQIALMLSHWLDDVASAILSIVNALRPTRKFQVVEQEDFAFLLKALRKRSARPVAAAPLRFIERKFVEDPGARILSRLAGGQVEIVLARHRFAFRFLELPGQASGFLDAIIRSQIDRLTPWSSSQAAFGCEPPKETSSGRIGVVVAATALSAVMPFVTALEAFKPKAIVVSTAPDPGGDQGRTIVFSQETNRESSMQRLRHFSWRRRRQRDWRLLQRSRLGYMSALIWELPASNFPANERAARRPFQRERRRLRSCHSEARAKEKRKSPATVIVLEVLRKPCRMTRLSDRTARGRGQAGDHWRHARSRIFDPDY